MKYIFDTNVLIDLQANRLPETSKQFILTEIDKDFTISFISYLEFHSFKFLTNSMKEFINLSLIIGINKKIIDLTIEKRIKTKVKLPDCIIAATAIIYDRVLITSNLKDFNKIEGLKIYNPYS